MNKSKKVVVGKLGNQSPQDTILAMLELDAKKSANFWNAIQNATTWASLQSQCDASLWEELQTQFQIHEVPMPAADCLFDASQIPGFEDGDWPQSPQTSIKDWLPNSAVPLLRQFATVHNGKFCEFSATDQTRLITILEKEGFVCILNDTLIQRACGIEVESNSTEQPKLGFVGGMMRKHLLSKISSAEILIAETILDLRKLKAQAESIRQEDLKNSIDSPLLHHSSVVDQFRNSRFMEIDLKKKELAGESNRVDQVCNILKKLKDTKVI